MLFLLHNLINLLSSFKNEKSGSWNHQFDTVALHYVLPPTVYQESYCIPFAKWKSILK